MQSVQHSQFTTLNAKYPLYLGNRVDVFLDDGPSLVVSKVALVCCRYPLQRISRLIIGAGACMQADVIPACLSADIPLIWRHRDGSALAVALPLQGRELDWGERIAVMMAYPHWQDCYHAWVAAQQNMALRSLARRFCLPANHGRQGEWLDSLWHRHGIRRCQAADQLRAWQAMIVGIILEYWRTLDIEVDLLSSPADGWNVLHDMANCLVLDMVVEQVWQKKKWQRLRTARRSDIEFALIQAFERRQPRLLNLLEAMHARFHRWLLEMEPWR